MKTTNEIMDLNDYTEGEIDCMKRFGINIVPGEEFQAGIHCPGSTPLKNSNSCYATCYGTKGMMATTCVHQTPCEKYKVVPPGYKIFKKSMEKSIAEIG